MPKSYNFVPALILSNAQESTGKEQDETGLYFYAWRYYDPTLGRFLQPDTIVPNPRNPQDLNRYTYAGNNPIVYTDPTGHAKFKDIFKKFFSAAASFVGMALMPINPALGIGLFAAGQGFGLAQAIQAGQVGSWAIGFGVSLVMGGFLPPINAANPFVGAALGALRGAAIGAISGGVASALTGGSFGQGAYYGALGGALGGAAAGFFSSSGYVDAVTKQSPPISAGTPSQTPATEAQQQAVANHDPVAAQDAAGAVGGAEAAQAAAVAVAAEASGIPIPKLAGSEIPFPAWSVQGGASSGGWSLPPPDAILGFGARVLGAASKLGWGLGPAGRALSITAIALKPAGRWEVTLGLIGGIGGAGVGQMVGGPPGAVAGGTVGSLVGSRVGRTLDPPYAGSANYYD